MLINEKHLAELNSPVQTINARVELHSGSTLAQICTCKDYLGSLTIERVGVGKFFGYGICHKLQVTFIDYNRELDLTNIDFMEVTFGVDGEFIYPFPTFYVLEVNRDETTNELSVVAYDKLYQTTNYKVSDLTLPSSYTLLYFASACAALLGISVKFENITDISAFMIEYKEGGLPNFDGTEPLRQALDALAEVTQTIYYLNGDWELTFKRLDQAGAPVATVDKEHYIELTSGAECRLGAICHTTELGDSVTTAPTTLGVTQYLRNNPFLEVREDIGALLDNAIDTVRGLTIYPFNCSWVGNYLLEIGDKVAFLADDAGEIVTYIVDDAITFDGTLGQLSRWEYISDEAETADNPTTLGEALNQTTARVDKVNQKIDLEIRGVNGQLSAINQTLESISLKVQEHEEEIKAFEELETGQFVDRVAEIEIELDSINTEVSGVKTDIEELEGDVGGLLTRVTTAETNIEQNREAITLRATKEEVESIDGKVEANITSIGALQVSNESISASVERVEKNTKEQIDGIAGSIEELTKKVELSMTEEAVKIAIETELSDGVDKVKTNTGFTFDDTGLLIEKDDSEISTKITENGMTVSKGEEAVLTANNQGVNAVNLYATTFLIVGGNSRFENYDNNGEIRTACFWIGS